MNKDSINFFYQTINYTLLKKSLTRQWLHRIAKMEGYKIYQLNYIFCNDEYLLEINKDYLNHDNLTDIITFNLSDKNELIEGEIYISLNRIKENAKIFKEPKEKELRRVMAHGLLHLMGYKDKTPMNILTMRKKEDTCLSLWSKMSK
jgi:probable rRNA maturation factor